MIDRPAFARVMGVFADRIGRPLAPETAELYYAVLSADLETDEFLAGARVVFQVHRFNTWPAPQQFIDAARPPAAIALAAGELFERVLAIAANAYTPLAERTAQIAALGADVERAYRAAGGRREFENVLEADVKWLRKAFCESYQAAVIDTEARRSAHVALAAVDATARDLIDQAAEQLGIPAHRRRVPALPARQ